MAFTQLDHIRFIMGFDQVMSMQDVDSGQCTIAARSLIIERILKRQGEIASMESFHRGTVTYALPVLLIQKIIRMLWRTLWMDYNHRATAYSSLLELCLVSKEMFHFVSSTLFTSLDVNWLQVIKNNAASEHHKALLNPYSPYKRAVRTSEGPLKNLVGCTLVTEWLHFCSHVRRLDIRYYTAMQEYIDPICLLDHLTLQMEEYADYMRLVKMTTLKTFVVTQTTRSHAPSFPKYLHAQDTLTSLSLINVTIDVDELSRILANKPSIIKLVIHTLKMPVIPATIQTLFVIPPNDWPLINNNSDDKTFMVTYLRIMKENRDLSYLTKMTTVSTFRMPMPFKGEDTGHLFSQILQSSNIERIIFDINNSDYKPTPPDITPQSIEEWSNCSAYGLSIIRLTLSRNGSLKVTFAKTTATDQVSNQP
eukprot:gene11423-13315_t